VRGVLGPLDPTGADHLRGVLRKRLER